MTHQIRAKMASSCCRASRCVARGGEGETGKSGEGVCERPLAVVLPAFVSTPCPARELRELNESGETSSEGEDGKKGKVELERACASWGPSSSAQACALTRLVAYRLVPSLTLPPPSLS
jgi:hypothetical protein